MKKYRILAVVLFVCALAGLGLQVLPNVVGHRPATSGLTFNDTVLWVANVLVAVYFWFFGREHEKRLKQYAEASAQRTARGAESSVSSPRDYPGLLVAIERRLGSAGYSVVCDVALPTGDIADLVASRVEFTFHGLVNTPVVQHLFLQHLKVATVKDFETLFEAGCRYARRMYRSSVLRRKHFGHVILPCIAVDTATPDFITAASSRPPKRWMRFEFPVLYDLSTGRTYYYSEKTPTLGAMLFPGARALANLAFDIEHPSTVS